MAAAIIAKHTSFKFYNGETGEAFDVLEFIDDGKKDFVVDQEEKLRIVELLRWSDDGGKHHR